MGEWEVVHCPRCGSPDTDSTKDGLGYYCKECGFKWSWKEPKG